MKRLLWLVGVLLVAWWLWPQNPPVVPVTPPDIVESVDLESAPAATPPAVPDQIKPPARPASFLIKDVPFVPQAPLKIWDSLHEDACEEASLLTVRAWLAGRQPDVEESERDIQAFVAWQSGHGFGPSITVSDLKKAAEGYWPRPWWHALRVRSDGTLDDIRQEIVAGHPVIIGAAGKRLLNPHFKNGGPNYHMLVLIGYTADEFVANDPGTRVGEGFHYPAAAINDAWHDWDTTDIIRGARNYLVAE